MRGTPNEARSIWFRYYHFDDREAVLCGVAEVLAAIICLFFAWWTRGALRAFHCGFAVFCVVVAWLFFREVRWGFRAKRRAREGRCVTCGYQLTGLPEPRCPECGTAFNLKEYPDLSVPRPERRSE